MNTSNLRAALMVVFAGLLFGIFSCGPPCATYVPAELVDVWVTDFEKANRLSMIRNTMIEIPDPMCAK